MPNDRAARAFLGQPPVDAAPPATGDGGIGAGDDGVGEAKAPGTQFITGECASDADCASDCCGFNSGKCAGPVIAQERDGGCGFGEAVPNDRAARVFLGQPAAPPIAAPAAPAAGDDNAGNDNIGGEQSAGITPGTQFITGACTSDADCASDCCGFNSGKCAGPIVAQERDGGCGFGDAEPNDRAAQSLRGQRLGRRGVVAWRGY